MLKAVTTPRKSSPELENANVTVDSPGEKEYCKDCLQENNEAETEAVIEKKYIEEPRAGVIHRTVTRIKNYVAEFPQIPQPSEKNLFNGAVGLASVGVAALALNVRRKTNDTSSVEQQIQQVEQSLDETNRKLGEAQARRQAGGDELSLREASSLHTVADSGQDLTQIQGSLVAVQQSVAALTDLVNEQQPQVEEQGAQERAQILEKLGNLSRGIVFLVERIREVRAAQQETTPAAASSGGSVDLASQGVATQARVDELWQEMYQVEDRIKQEVAAVLEVMHAQEDHFGISKEALEDAMNHLLNGMPTLLSHANSEQNLALNGEFLKVMQALQLLQGRNVQSSQGLTEADKTFLVRLHKAPVEGATVDPAGLQEVKEGVAALEKKRKDDRGRLDSVDQTTAWIKKFLEENRDKILSGDSGQALRILQELQQREPRQAPVLTEEVVRKILQEFKDELKSEIPAQKPPRQEPTRQESPKPIPKPAESPREKPAQKPAPKQPAPKPKPRPVPPPAAAPPLEEVPKPKHVFQLAKVTVNTSFFGGQIKQMENLNTLVDRVNSSFEKFAYTVAEADAINKQVEEAIGELLKQSSSRTPFYKALQQLKQQNNQSLNTWKKGYVTNQETGKTPGNARKLTDWIKRFKVTA
jgi:hypothetical protein